MACGTAVGATHGVLTASVASTTTPYAGCLITAITDIHAVRCGYALSERTAGKPTPAPAFIKHNSTLSGGQAARPPYVSACRSGPYLAITPTALLIKPG